MSTVHSSWMWVLGWDEDVGRPWDGYLRTVEYAEGSTNGK